MLRVGLIGIGFMGWIHYLAYQRMTAAKVSAICTRDPKKAAGDWTDIKGNFGPPGERVDLTGIATYSDWQQLLESPEIDAIDICLPPAMHKEVAITALTMGKHVLCEKPMALDVADCEEMLNVAAAHGRTLAVAHVLPYMGPFEYALSVARSKKHGRILSAHFKRIISDPTWIPDFYNAAKVGGPMIDLHIHDAHFLQLLFGTPANVTAAGWQRDGVAQYAQMLYRFPDGQQVATAASGVCNSDARMFTHGYEIQFERAVLSFEFAAHSAGAETFGLFEYDSSGKATTVDLPPKDDIDGFVAEISEFINLIQGGSEKDSPLSAKHASNAVRICKAVEASVISGTTETL